MNLDDLAWIVEDIVGRFREPAAGSARDVEVDALRQEYRNLVARRELIEAAGIRRSEKLAAIGSRASFPGGLTKVGGSLQPVMIAVTDTDVVLLHADVDADPTGEIARIPTASVAAVHITDEFGNPVLASALDPVRELDTPEEERYAVVLERSDAQAPLSLLFLSGEPASFAYRKLREHLGVR